MGEEVDRRMICLREADARSYEKWNKKIAEEIRSGAYDHEYIDLVNAFTLYEEGFGK